MLHDTHFHLDLFPDPGSVVREIEAAQVYTIAVTNLPALFSHTRQLTNGCKYARPALGFHPELIYSRADQLTLFEQLLPATKYIGEIGLDNLRKAPEDFAEQRRVFESIINLCDEAGSKILTVHSRRAEKDVISIIGSQFRGKVILHWYSGSISELKKALDYGFYFSVNKPMTESPNGQKIIQYLPTDRILLETDGPYTKTEDGVAHPPAVLHTATTILQLKRAEVGSCGNEIFSKNFRAMLT